MAAYAALVSLINIIDHVHDHPRLSSILDKNQTKYLEKKLGFFLDLIETAHSHGVITVISEEAQALESQITRVVYAAEDVIESHIVDQIRSASISLLDLQTVIHEIESIKEKVINVKEARRIRGPQLITYERKSSASTSSTMVGCDQELIQLMDALTGQERALKIIPIVGMGGIGKTTLARNAYDNSFIVHHFHLRAWATISQNNYSVREIFSKLLSCQSYKSTSELDGETEDELAQKMYQSLIGRRYLIVLDDVWGIGTWEGMKRFFPDNGNGSRIVVTTRLSSLATHVGSYYLPLNFLDEDNSWILFCQKAFPTEGCCPPELEKVGKKIAKKCKGLPLLICVIGALLRNSSLRQEYWENVSKDINSIPKSKEDEQRLDILSLSYSYLPVHLKPCFLYMGCFPENHEIRVSQLVKLWVAEGFLRPNKSQSLEEVAIGHLNDLIDRNLIVAGRLGSNAKIRTCGVHDLLRDLCVKAAHREKFLRVMSVYDSTPPRDVDDQARRIVFHEGITKEHHARFHRTLKSAALTRSWISNGTWISYKFTLLRVSSSVANSHLSDLDDTLGQHVNLRFLNKPTFRRTVVNSHHLLPSSISLLWNLQTLTIRGCAGVSAPHEIWEMRQLRHIEFDQICLPEPPLSCQQEDDDVVVLRSLQTLVKVLNLRLSEEVCKRIPNIKKLKIKYDELSTSSYDYYVDNILHLLKLESLHFICKSKTGRQVRWDLKLPSSLQKLTLVSCRLYWEDLTLIGSLPHLQVLKLRLNSGLGSSEWNPIEGEFRCLKFLGIYDCNELKVWNAEKSHFPIIHGLSKLYEVPWGVGEIPTLGVIDLDGCSESAAISAFKILEEQESLGNDGLQVRIKFWDKAKLDIFREKAEQELGGFTSNNLRRGPINTIAMFMFLSFHNFIFNKCNYFYMYRVYSSETLSRFRPFSLLGESNLIAYNIIDTVKWLLRPRKNNIMDDTSGDLYFTTDSFTYNYIHT